MARKSKAKIAARRLPANMQAVAFTKFSAKAERRRRERGSFGAASAVRVIDPKTGEVIETIEAT
ncbi:hypothetical protein ACX9MO_05195 [Pseudooceanicola sp. 502str34]